VADRVLPALLVLAVVGEAVHDELVDAVQGDAPVRRVLDGHGDERDVAVGRLDHVLAGRGARGGGRGRGAGRVQRLVRLRQIGGQRQ